MFNKKIHAKVFKSGLFVNEHFPNYAATPDGVIDDDTIVEVKCPYSARNEFISESNSITFLEKNAHGIIELKSKHNYYAQIQGQLAISWRKMCILIVFTLKDLQIFEINFDPDFIERELLPSLDNFFMNVYLPFLTSKLWKFNLLSFKTKNKIFETMKINQLFQNICPSIFNFSVFIERKLRD